MIDVKMFLLSCCFGTNYLKKSERETYMLSLTRHGDMIHSGKKKQIVNWFYHLHGHYICCIYQKWLLGTLSWVLWFILFGVLVFIISFILSKILLLNWGSNFILLFYNKWWSLNSQGYFQFSNKFICNFRKHNL